MNPPAQPVAPIWRFTPGFADGFGGTCRVDGAARTVRRPSPPRSAFGVAPPSMPATVDRLAPGRRVLGAPRARHQRRAPGLPGNPDRAGVPPVPGKLAAPAADGDVDTSRERLHQSRPTRCDAPDHGRWRGVPGVDAGIYGRRRAEPDDHARIGTVRTQPTVTPDRIRAPDESVPVDRDVPRGRRADPPRRLRGEHTSVRELEPDHARGDRRRDDLNAKHRRSPRRAAARSRSHSGRTLAHSGAGSDPGSPRRRPGGGRCRRRSAPQRSRARR